ncbi:hypothetical protein L873DRAFT_390164 [Choiromyces venosus 120613-1]|uniref:Uncharacterized protein n=1 Tax=Choiromyces venosus 120613-1 TaxID=1336337 RepID=A0A3N4IXU6_9PEZI|nr:hypothetical protein L873DRAFT_390164 [Choiromyces venosus 120613-1]
MSLYLKGKQSLEELVDPHGWSSTTSSSPTPFEKQASLIPDKNKYEYQSARELVRVLISIIELGSAEEYFLYFHGIIAREFESIERELHAVQLRSAVRFTFENSLHAAILRIMPGPEHEKVGIELYMIIVMKIASIPGHSHESIAGVSATRFQVPGVRSKEGDQGLHPDTRIGRGAWPSLMIEVGYSEGLNLLHLDAEWWLKHSQSRTRFVIITKISRNPFHIRIECWRMVATVGRQTRQTPTWIPRCVQDFNIDAAGVVVSPLGSTELQIPYDCIFDQPSPTAQPVIFSFAELSHFALRLFRLLQ